MAILLKVTFENLNDEIKNKIKDTLNIFNPTYIEDSNCLNVNFNVDENLINEISKNLTILIKEVKIDIERPFYRRSIKRAGQKWHLGKIGLVGNDLFIDIFKDLGLKFRRFLNAKFKKVIK